jgi:hypothetical protein
MHAVGRIALHGYLENAQFLWGKRGLEDPRRASTPAATISAAR